MSYDIREYGESGWDCLLPWVGHDGDQARLECVLCRCRFAREIHINLSGLDDYRVTFTDADWPRTLGLDDRQAIARWADEMCRALSTFAGSGVTPWPRGEKP